MLDLIRRRALVRTGTLVVAAGALIAGLTAASSGAVVRPRASFPAYPTKLTPADIKLAAKYIGGAAGKAAKGSPVTIGFLNDDTGQPAYPENYAGAQIAQDLINKQLGGIKGHPLAFDECDVSSTTTAASCATSMVAAHVKVVLTGTIIAQPDSAMYQILFAAGIPVIVGNGLTTTDFAPPQAPAKGTAVTYMPGSPGVVLGMAKFIGTGGTGKKPTTVTGFYLQGDSGSQTAFNALFKGSPFLSGVTVKGEQINLPWSLSDVEAAESAAPAGSLFVPLLPVQQCISFAQGMTALTLKNTVVTTGLCFGKQLKTTLGNYPNGWYFGDYGINYFMYDKALLTSQQLAVYIAAVEKYNKTIDYTGFAGPSFSNVLTVTKFYNQLGVAATSAKLAGVIKAFKGPQWGISGPMSCGKVDALLFPTICGKYIGMAQFLNGKWLPTQDAYNNKLINPF
jgi:branched-chain amino acid transport system substrate-binding protein